MFRGQLLYPVTYGIPASYLPQWISMTTPVYISILFVVSCVVFAVTAIKSKFKIIFQQDREFLFTLFLVSFLCPAMYAILKSSFVLYNGWRHMYFLYVYYFLCAMYLLDIIIEYCGKNSAPKAKALLIGTVLAVGIGFVSTFADMVINRSYEYAYFNRLTRHFTNLDAYDGDYWNVSVRPTLYDFADLYYDGQNPLKVALMGYAQGGQDWSGIENEQIDLVDEGEADYFLFNTSIKAQLLEDMSLYEQVFATNKFGYDLSAVYVKK